MFIDQKFGQQTPWRALYVKVKLDFVLFPSSQVALGWIYMQEPLQPHSPHDKQLYEEQANHR